MLKLAARMSKLFVALLIICLSFLYIIILIIQQKKIIFKFESKYLYIFNKNF